MSLRDRRRRPGPTCHGMQESTWYRVARHQVLNDIILRAINAADVPAVKEPSGFGSEQAGWITARWIVPNSVAERQTPSVRCHGGQHASRVICGHSRDWSRTCSWSGSRQKDSQTRRSQSTVCFSAGVSWKPRSIQLFNVGLSERPRSQNLSYFRW